MMVVLALAFALPASQLRTASVEKACCCPDPAKCHCPDHDDGPPGQPQIKACHQTSHVTVAPTLPAFAAPALAALPAPAVELVAAFHVTLAPSAAPPPARPDAPS